MPMTEPLLFPDLALAREQAAEWIARADRGLTATEQREFRLWQASPANARALRELAAMWKDMDQLEVLAEVFPRPAAARAAIPATRRRWPMAVAASIVAAACGVMLALVLSTGMWRRSAAVQMAAVTPARHATAVGEQRVVALPDGSTLALNTDTVVEVSLQAGSRDLRLLRGEAHFTVAHDQSRPFMVTVGKHTVRAVGTAFDVRLRDGNALDVLVTEGVVRLGRADGSQPAATDLAAGQLLQVDTRGRMHVQKLDSGGQGAWLAWRDGMLLFEGQTLQSALDEFSRYTTDRFSIADPQLRDMRIGGYFPAGNTSALLTALNRNFGLAAQRGADGRWLIARASAPPASD
jgi:transmembrane sensor